MVLELRSRFDSSGAYSAAQQQGVPAWRTGAGIDDKMNWWGGPGTDENEAFYWSLVDNHAYIQYGKNQSAWAGCRVIDEILTWTNERQNPDGSVECDVTVDIGDYWGRTTDYFTGSVPVVHRVKVGDQTVITYSGGTGDAFRVAANPNRVTKHISVSPQSYSDTVQLYMDVHYPTGVFPDAHFEAGLTLYNPTPPAYIPMSTRKNGQWLNLNDHGGHISIRHATWQDRSKELFTTQRQENQGHNRIRRSGKWLQLPKM
jgi:hypothetical protein